jgi:polar amino acid transport system substrate-binding protein
MRLSIATALCACVVLLAPAAAPVAESAAASRGLLLVAVDTTAAPYGFVGSDGESVRGLDADLAGALAAVLGYRLRLVAADPGEILPGLASGRYDLGMSLVDTSAHERSADLLGYLSTGTSFVVDAAGGPAIRRTADLCGRSVAVARGTAQAAAAAAQSAACSASGRRAVGVSAVADPAAAVADGRVQVALLDPAVAGYAVKRSRGRLRLTASAPGSSVRAIGIAKDFGRADEFRGALATLMDEGTYDTILARWGAQAAGVASARLNAARR